MIHLTCELDCDNLYLPGHKEGFGSAFQMIIGAYAISRYCNVDFMFTPMKNIGHSEYFEYSQEEWDKRFENYCREKLLPQCVDKIEYQSTIFIRDYDLNECEHFLEELKNRKEDILVCLDWKPIKSICDANIHIIDEIKDSLISYYHLNEPKNSVLSVHARVFSKTDCDPSAWRGYYTKDSSDRLIETCRSLIKNHDLDEVHVHSQGSAEEFEKFNDLGKVKLFLDVDPIETLDDMITSKVLLMSRSSFSYIASMYRKNSYALDYFQHSLTKDTYVI